MMCVGRSVLLGVLACVAVKADPSLVAEVDTGSTALVCAYAKVGDTLRVIAADSRYYSVNMTAPTVPVLTSKSLNTFSYYCSVPQTLQIVGEKGYFTDFLQTSGSFNEVDLATGVSRQLDFSSSSENGLWCTVTEDLAYLSTGQILNLTTWQFTENTITLPPGGLVASMRVDANMGLLFVASGGSVLIYSTSALNTPLYTFGVMSQVSDTTLDTSKKVLAVVGDTSALIDYSVTPPRIVMVDTYEADYRQSWIEGNVFGLVWDSFSVIELNDITKVAIPVQLSSTPANSGPFVSAPVLFGSYIAIGRQVNFPSTGTLRFSVYWVKTPLPPLPPDGPSGGGSSGLPTYAYVAMGGGGAVVVCVLAAVLVTYFIMKHRRPAVAESGPLNAAAEGPPMYTP